MLLVTQVVLIVLVLAAGAEFAVADVGNVFEKAGEIAAYADERLAAAAAAASGDSLPDAPQILADQTTLQIGLAVSIAFQIALIGVVVWLSRQSIPQLVQGLRLDRYAVLQIWRPVLVTIGLYVMVATYSVVVNALDIGILEPRSTVPFEIVRHPLTIVLTGITAVIGAPLAEELFYRGLVFGGLLKWGFWPAALLSGAIFSGVHLDLGSLIPFFAVGVVLAWIFWRRGNLWESITVHFLFNLTSFGLLLALEA